MSIEDFMEGEGFTGGLEITWVLEVSTIDDDGSVPAIVLMVLALFWSGPKKKNYTSRKAAVIP